MIAGKVPYTGNTAAIHARRTPHTPASAREPAGEAAIGGNAVPTVLKAASELRKEHPGVSFRFFIGDATDVCERLDHGSLDFAMLLAP